MSAFLEILKCLLCCEEEYHDRERYRREYYHDHDAFLRNPAPSHSLPQSNPQTVIQVRDVSSRVYYPPPRVQTPPRASPSVQTPPRAPPRVQTPLRASPSVQTPPRAPPRVQTPPRASPRVQTPPRAPPRVQTPLRASPSVQTPPRAPPRVQTPPRASPSVQTPPRAPPRVQTPLRASPSVQTPPRAPPRVQTPPRASPRVQTPPRAPPRVQTPLRASPSVQTPPRAPPRVQTPPRASPSVQTPPRAPPRVQTPLRASPSVQTPPRAPPRVQTPPRASPSVQTPPRAPPRVQIPPRIPQRVPVIPVNEVFGDIDGRTRDVAESVSLSPSDSYPPPSSSSSSRSSVKHPPQSPLVSKSVSPLYKTTLALASGPSNLKNQEGRTKYNKVKKDPSPIYVVPKDIADLIKKDIVPGVLRRPLSPSTYEDYFGALLYAEDFYIEKWSNYLLNDVTVQLHKASIYRRDINIFQNESDDKTFVAFEVDSVPGRRPFLLSRDFVYLQPSATTTDLFQGIIYRVVKSNTVLVEFDEDFYSKHYPSCKYNVSFSFNKFCLKRAHQAIQAASDPAFQKFLFPEVLDRDLSSITPLSLTRANDLKQSNALVWILSLNSAPPYLLEGPLSVHDAKNAKLSKTGLVVKEAIVHIHRTSPNSRILVCAPTNNTCDAIVRNLKMEICESDMFRANAAFREIDGVPIDVLPSCHYRDDCFTCPSLENLRKFKVVLSTYVSSSRLKGEGIGAGHFSHIFLMDASCVTEPEMMVALANLANDETAVVVTGAPPKNCSNWVRSNIARQNGLRVSYFERLRESLPYKSLNPRFISQMRM